MTEPNERAEADRLLAEADRFLAGVMSDSEASAYAESLDRPGASEALSEAVRLRDALAMHDLTKAGRGPKGSALRRRSGAKARAAGYASAAAILSVVWVGLLWQNVRGPVARVAEFFAAEPSEESTDDGAAEFAAVWPAGDVVDEAWGEEEPDESDVPDWMLAAAEGEEWPEPPAAGLETL